MKRLEISNLSFCELDSRKNFDAKGGLYSTKNFRYEDISFNQRFLKTTRRQVLIEQIISNDNNIIAEAISVAEVPSDSQSEINQSVSVNISSGNRSRSYAQSIGLVFDF
jgi:hypothetical protein